MADRPDVASYKLAADTGDFVGPMKAAAQVSDQLTGAVAKTDVAIEKAARTVKYSSDYFERQERKLDAAARAEYNYAKAVEDANKARAAGIGTDQQLAAHIDRLAAKRDEEIAKINARKTALSGDTSAANDNYRTHISGLNAQGAAMQKSATMTGLARHEMINFSRQLQDIGVSLAGGQSPLRIAIEQGSQIVDVFATSQATLGGFVRQIGSWGASLLTPFRAVVGGIATVGTAILGASASFNSAQKEVEVALLGIGRASGATVQGIEDIAEASTTTFGLSISEAREFASQLASTGKIGVSSFGELTAHGRDLARALGVNLKEAGDIAAKALSAPAASIDQLNAKLGRWDAATVQLIKNLAEQNRITEAQALIQKGLIAAADDAAKAAGFWETAWTKATNKISNMWNDLATLGKKVGLVKLPIEEQLAAAETKLKNMQEAFAKFGGAEFLAGGKKAIEDQVAEVERLRAAWEAAGQATAMAAAEQKRIAESQVEKKLVRDLSPEIAQMEAMNNKAAALDDLMARINETGGKTSPILQDIGETFEAVALSAERAKENINVFDLQIQLQRESQQETQRHVTAVTELAAKYQGVSIEVARMLDSLKQQTAVAQAAPGPARAAVEDEARLNQLRLEGKSILERTAVVEAERKSKVAQANAAIEQQNHTLKQNGELALANIEGRGDAVRVEQAYTNAIRAGANAHVAANAAQEQAKSNAALRLAQEILATREYNAQLQAINARTAEERQAAAGVQAYNQALAEGKTLWQAQLAETRAINLETEKMAASHKDIMASLQGQLKVAQATTEEAKRRAQYQADISTAERAGFTSTQAQEQAAMKRKIAEAQAEQSSRKVAVANDRAARAVENVYRVWAYGVEIFQGSASDLATAFYGLGAGVMDLKAKLAGIGTVEGAKTRGFQGFGIAAPGGTFGSATGPLVGSAGMSTALNLYNLQRAGAAFYGREPQTKEDQDRIIAEIEEAAKAAADAARAQQDAARASQDAAIAAEEAAQQQAEAAKAAREAYISQLDDAVKDIIATKLLAGQTAGMVNAAIEAGQIPFGTASNRFESQLELYKRAGASSAQIAADIRAGIIGEGARPSELLAALDSLTDAVNSNTEAQLGLSPFYTGQGDRALGYRGYTVQKGASNIPGAGTYGGTTGTGGTGTGISYSPGAGGGISGGIVNVGGGIAVSGGPTGYLPGTVAYEGWAVLPDGNWLYIPGGQVQDMTTNTWAGNIYSYKNGMYADVKSWLPGFQSIWPAGSPRPGGTHETIGMAEGGIMSAQGRVPLRSYQDGGIANSPQIAVFGEGSQPEAFVPLKGGAIPVKLMMDRKAANSNAPTNVININAPLIHFAAEPTRDEVRGSAFQAAQELRRVMVG
jgi:Prophage tail length tape measure protein